MTEQSILVYKLYKCFKQKGGGGAHYGYGLETLRKCSKRVETKKKTKNVLAAISDVSRSYSGRTGREGPNSSIQIFNMGKAFC